MEKKIKINKGLSIQTSPKSVNLPKLVQKESSRNLSNFTPQFISMTSQRQMMEKNSP